MTAIRKPYTPAPFPQKVVSMAQLQSWLKTELPRLVAMLAPDDHALDLRDLVAGEFGTADAAAIMAALAPLAENTPIINPGADLLLEQTLHIANRGGLRLISGREPRPNGRGNSPTVRWNGAEGGRMLFFDQTVNCHLVGYAFELDWYRPTDGPTAYTAIDVDGFEGPRDPNAPYYGMGSGCLFAYLNLRVNRPNANYEAFRISKTVDENQEYHQLHEVAFSGPVLGLDDPRLGTAFVIGPSANAKVEAVDGCRFNNWSRGVRMEGGSMHLGRGRFNTFTTNDIDIELLNASESSVSCANSELSRQHLVDHSGMGFTLLAGTRLGPQRCLPGTGYIEAGTILTCEGTVFFDSPPPDGATLFDLRRCRDFVSTGIRFAPGTTRQSSGFDTMPLEPMRFLISIGHPHLPSTDPNVPDIPAGIYIRGGTDASVRVDASISDYTRFIDMHIRAERGQPNIRGLGVTIEQQQSAGQGDYGATDFHYRRVGGGNSQAHPYATDTPEGPV